MDGRPTTLRHARTIYKGRCVDVDVAPDAGPNGSHLVIVVHPTVPGAADETIEIVTDDDAPDAALDTGLEVARAAIDGRGP